MKMREKKIKKQTTTQIESRGRDDQLTDEMLDDFKQVVEFHKWYLNLEMENEKAIYDKLNARIEELKSDVEVIEEKKYNPNDGFYF